MSSDKQATVNGDEMQHLVSVSPRAVAARYDAASGMITVDLDRGYSISFHKSRSQALHNATDEQLGEIDTGFPSLSIFFPKLDDGFTVEGLLAGRFGNRHWEQRWKEQNTTQPQSSRTAA